MRCRERHWETKDRIFGGYSKTDLLNQQCWYPSDNSVEDTDEERRIDEAFVFAHVPFGLLREAPPAQGTIWKARDPSRSLGPGVFLAAYVWGTNGRRPGARM